MIAEEAYVLSKSFTKKSLDGQGALKGAPCTIKSITEVDGGQKITFEWTGTSGTKQTSEMTVKNGVSVTGISDKGNGVFTLLLSDGYESDPIQCVKGEDGFSPTATVEKVGKIATITITDKNGTTTATIKDGEGSEGGEANTIDSISVNGVNVVPDENKNVDITVPSIEGLTKDADLATVAKSGNYEDLSNKPAIPSVEGLAKITDIPTKVSQLENDSNYLSSIPEEYVTETELEAKGYLTEHQDISGKVDKVDGKSLISDTEIARLASVDNYDDTDIRTELAKKADATVIPSKVSELTNDSNYQTAEQVNSTVTTEIAKVVADAPEDLNTLKEMSDWIAGHENDASAMNSAISDNKTAITALQTGKADKSDIPTTVAELTDSADYAKKTDIPTTLPADGGNADTVNNHTVETDVPVDAKFTDTVYDDTEVKGSIEEVNSNLSQLELSDIAGGKNLWSIGDIKVSGDITTKVLISGIFKSNTQYTIKLKTKSFTTSDIGHFEFIYTDGTKTIISWDKSIGGAYATTSDYGKTIDILQWTGWNHGEYAEFTEIQLEEGDTATPYEPYIPSIKMLEDEVGNANESLAVIGKCKNLLNPKLETTTQNGVTCTANRDGTYTLNGTATSEAAFYLIDNDNIQIPKGMYKTICSTDDNIKSAYYFSNNGWILDNQFEITQSDILSSMWIKVQQDYTCDNVIIKPMITTNLSATYDDFVPYTGDGETLTHDVAELKNDLVPKKIELQNVDERVTIKDNGSFIINGFAFVNLLVTFNETLQQWSNFVRLPRPKGGNVTVYCENSVRLTIYSQDNLPGDCGTYDIVQSGTEIRLLVNYEVA